MYRMTLYFVCFLLMIPTGVHAEFYKYTTEEGQVNYVDDLSKVPPEYLNQVKTYKTEEDILTESQKARRRSREQQQEALQRQAQLEEESRQKKQKAKAALRTKVTIRNDRVMVPVIIGYGILKTEALLVLDTGASITTLYRGVVDRLYMQSFEWTTARTAAGNQIDVGLATLDYIQVGPHRRENIRAGIVETTGTAMGHDGLLGMDILRGVNYRIDFTNQMIIWE
ncbi:hypothetical protein D3OALGA1CA_2643 [Olavius algarvensis associated proteobacterium Delta 3]|nr:hypothetical protein D3OALGA1CA_2643 [Olavius algarvensis associated proteobacterium Delta 3]CAB5131967.1 hypothetical protein D3OALGB2SA_3693 [Olavius algarvensis associated proteobacterium Delta 3]